MKILLTVISLLIIASSVLSYGVIYAYFQRGYPMLADKERPKDIFAAFMGAVPVAGPLDALIFIPLSPKGYQGIKFY